jgi:cell division protein FtsA
MRHVEREALLAAIDVGTSKVVALIGEVSRDGSLSIIGKGAVGASGLKKGVVVNIDQTVGSIQSAREAAERLSGYRIESANVGVGGNHVESENSRGAVAVSGARREVTHEDIERATEVARAVTIPSNREILHVSPRGFVVDGQEGVRDPLGMSAVRLEVETLIVHASATGVQNLTKCVGRAGIRIDELVCASLAAGEAVLTETERELGVAVADFGAGTIDLALYLDGTAFHARVLPLGGNNVTNDVAIGLKTSLQAAEELKISHGTADTAAVSADEQVEVAEGIGQDGSGTASRAELAGIIEARMREVFEKIGEEIERAGYAGLLPAGLVLTGGAAQLAGAARLGRDVLQMPVRVAGPAGVSGLTDHLLTPAYSTSLGLLLWGARSLRGYEQIRFDAAAGRGALVRMRDWMRGLFP